MIFTAQHAWQSESILSVFTKRCLQTGRREHCHYKHWAKCIWNFGTLGQPYILQFKSTPAHQVTWHIATIEVCANREYYHVATKIQNHLILQNMLPNFLKKLLKLIFTSSTKETTYLIIFTVNGDILHFNDIFIYYRMSLTYLFFFFCLGCAFIQVYRCAPVQWAAPQCNINRSDAKNGKLVKVSNNDRREGWRAEQVLIHGATHWMAPP